MELWQIWLALALIFIVIEICTSGFAIACFSLGALFAMICTLINAPLWVQIIGFAIGSTIAFIFIRPVAMKYLQKKEGADHKTGVDALIGREAKVSETIKADDYGRVAIDGDDWKAKSADGCEITAGTKVVIVSIESVVLTVKKV